MFNLFLHKFANATSWRDTTQYDLPAIKTKAMVRTKNNEGYDNWLYLDKNDSKKSNPNGYVTAPGGVLMDKEGQRIARSVGYKGDFKDKADFSKFKDATFQKAYDRRWNTLEKIYQKAKVNPNPEARELMADIMYQTNAFESWPKTRDALHAGDFNGMVNHLKDSKIYRDEKIGRRFRENVDQLGKAYSNKPQVMSENKPAISPVQQQTQPVTQQQIQQQPRVHTIQKGDTLYDLSKKYNVGVNKLMELNPNVNPRKLQINQKINY